MGRQEVYDATGGTFDEDRYGSSHMRLYLKRRTDAVCRIVNEASRGQSSLRILDVGCGTGLTLASLTNLPGNHRVVGVDFSRTMLQQAQDKARTLTNPPGLVLGSGLSLPFRDSTFDIVYATRFIHQFPHEEKRRLYQDLLRITRPGGLVILEFYARPYHLLRYYAQRIKSEREEFLSHFPTTHEMIDIVGSLHSIVPLRLAGERILHRLLSEANVEKATHLAASWPVRLLVDEYFVITRK